MNIQYVEYSALLLLPLAYFFYRKGYFSSPSTTTTTTSTNSDSSSSQGNPSKEEKPKTIMQPAKTDLLPPKDDPYTLEQLKAFDGSDPSKPIYVSIKGTVFDVTHKKDVYGPGKSYSVFAGKDGSKGLGMSSLKAEHAVPDYSQLDEKDRKTLDDWHEFFLKRYNVVGRVTDLPAAVAGNDVRNKPESAL